MATVPTAINVALSTYANFTASAPSQLQNANDFTNQSYVRQARLTQDCLTLAFYTSSVVFPLSNLYQVAIGVNSALGWPPQIIIQPTSSYVTHPTSSWFFISASVANNTGISYQWFSQSYSQSLTSSTQFFPLTNSLQYTGCTGSQLNYLTSSVLDNSSSYYCFVTGSSGQTSSSIVQFSII